MNDGRALQVLLALILAGCIAGIIASQVERAPFTVRIAFLASRDDEDYFGAMAFKQTVEALLPGRVDVQIFPSGQFCGSERECIEGLQSGVLEMHQTTVGGLATLYPEVQVLDLPYTFPDDAVAEWKTLLESVLGGFFETQGIDEADRGALIEAMARWMTGTLAAAYFLQLVASLLLARWWQSLLYNPGGFRQEFHALRLSRGLALVALPLFAAVVVDGLPDVLRYLALPVAAAFFLQGLALAHGQLAAFNAGPGWLIGIYALLVVAPPYAFMALTTAGYADAWMDFRARMAKRTGGQDRS